MTIPRSTSRPRRKLAVFATKRARRRQVPITKPNRVACGACHDNVNFATGENHANLPQVSDNLCGTCHQPKGELDFDISIAGAHMVPTKSSLLPGVVFEIQSVTDNAAGQRPTVVFTVKDKAGKPIKAADMSRLSLHLAGPNSDYTTYVTEDVRKADGAGDGRHWWTFNTAIPATAKGSFTVAIEGRMETKLLAGTKKEQTIRDAASTSRSTSQSMVRRWNRGAKSWRSRSATPATAHLAFHGGSRNTTEQCIICHNPTKTGRHSAWHQRRYARDDPQDPHGQGTRSSVHGRVLRSEQEFGYPGDRRNCGQCHVNNSEQLPLNAAHSNVADPAGPLSPMGPATAACTGCHDSMQALSHALANSPKGSESCGTCHGPNADFSVNRLHAR